MSFDGPVRWAYHTSAAQDCRNPPEALNLPFSDQFQSGEQYHQAYNGGEHQPADANPVSLFTADELFDTYIDLFHDNADVKGESDVRVTEATVNSDEIRPSKRRRLDKPEVDLGYGQWAEEFVFVPPSFSVPPQNLAQTVPSHFAEGSQVPVHLGTVAHRCINQQLGEGPSSRPLSPCPPPEPLHVLLAFSNYPSPVPSLSGPPTPAIPNTSHHGAVAGPSGHTTPDNDMVTIHCRWEGCVNPTLYSPGFSALETLRNHLRSQHDVPKSKSNPNRRGAASSMLASSSTTTIPATRMSCKWRDCTYGRPLSVTSIMRHVMDKHTAEVPDNCPRCGTAMKPRDRNKHLKTCQGASAI